MCGVVTALGSPELLIFSIRTTGNEEQSSQKKKAWNNKLNTVRQELGLRIKTKYREPPF